MKSIRLKEPTAGFVSKMYTLTPLCSTHRRCLCLCNNDRGGSLHIHYRDLKSTINWLIPEQVPQDLSVLLSVSEDQLWRVEKTPYHRTQDSQDLVTDSTTAES